MLNKTLFTRKNLITLLINQDDIPAEYEDHPLQGNWRGYRE